MALPEKPPAADIVQAPPRSKPFSLPLVGGALVFVAIVTALFLGKDIGLQKRAAAASPTKAAATRTPSPAPPTPPGAVGMRPNVWVTWDSNAPERTNTFAFDGLVIRPSFRRIKNELTPFIEVTAPTGARVALQGVSNDFRDSTINFGSGKFDGYSSLPQVVMTSYSGGAHCCLKIVVAEYIQNKWKSVTVYNADTDEIPFPLDRDGDGILDFGLNDERFNYEFASHAGSWTPPLVLDIENGRVVDVSKRPAYRKVFESDMSQAGAVCETGKYIRDGKSYDAEINGACAAYVADAAVLGRVQEAWSNMLNHYDHSNGGDGSADAGFLPTKCFAPLVDFKCPPGQQHTFASYPEALRWFLGDTGYLPPLKIVPN